MEQFLENAGNLLAVIVPIFGGLLWISRKMDKNQCALLRKVAKIDKHKVSYKVCDQRRSHCPGHHS